MRSSWFVLYNPVRSTSKNKCQLSKHSVWMRWSSKWFVAVCPTSQPQCPVRQYPKKSVNEWMNLPSHPVYLYFSIQQNEKNWVYLVVKTCEFFLCLGVIVCVLYIVSGLFVVLLVLCFTSLVGSQVFTPRMSQKICNVMVARYHIFLTFVVCNSLWISEMPLIKHKFKNFLRPGFLHSF